MKPRKTAYLLHRWLGLIVSVQLLAWSLGGFVFSVLPLAQVRGERDIAEDAHQPLQPYYESISPVRALSALRGSRIDASACHALVVRSRAGAPVAVALDAHGLPMAAIDLRTGLVRPPLTADEAAALAERDFGGRAVARRVVLVERDPPIEYRGRPLPAWRVELGHWKRPHIYVHARSGEITARRNRLWRVFDFFWMLHIMDYRGRENFNHWLLTTMSALAVCTASSGLVLWGWRLLPGRATTDRGVAGAPS